MSNQCPKVIAQGLFAVQSKVKRLVHDAENNYASYKYVSIDAYYEAVRPWLNEAGIMIIPNEVEAGISPDGKTQKVVFAFYIMHKDGEFWDWPIRRTVYLPFTGAQASGSALSYAEKFAMRTLFKIPTGEYDPEQDAVAPPEVEKSQKQVVTDADAVATVRGGGQDTELDYSYAGPPYRIFNPDMSIKQTFTDIRPWGTLLRTLSNKQMPEGGKERLINANRQEIDRVRQDVVDDGTLTAKAKANLLTSLDSLIPSEEGTNEENNAEG